MKFCCVWCSSLPLFLLTPGLWCSALDPNNTDLSLNFTNPVNLTDSTNPKNNTFDVKHKKQYYLTESGVYRYNNLGSINETIFLPNGANIETWVARYNISRAYPLYMAGWDDENRPIWVAEFGKWNIKGIIEAGHLEEFNFYAMQCIHFVVKSRPESSTPELPVHKYIAVLDMDGLQMDQLLHIPTVRWCIALAREYNTMALKHLGEAIVINANYVVTLFAVLIKPLIGSAYANVNVYGNQRISWMPHLFRRIPIKYIPPWYGGNKDFKPVRVLG